MNELHPERVALEAAVRAGLVPAALAREAVERRAALLQAGQQVTLLALVAERLDPRARDALARFLGGARETGGSTVPGGPPRSTSTFASPRGVAVLPGPGARVAGYTLERELGRGGMGAVFAAVSTTGQRVALKLLLGAADAQHAERFLREANAARKLQHPGIVGLHEAGVDEHGRLFMAMQLVDGESLRDRLERTGPLPSREAARLLLEVAHALEHAHAQLVLHRDLKPHNVLLASDGRALLADFGLARDAHDARLTTTGELLGTPAYMAPEQAAGERRRVDARSDVYGLGATLYHLLTGRPPFEGATVVNVITQVLTRAPAPPSASRKDVDPDLEAICLRCLEKEPADRYPSAASLAEDLGRWLAGAATASPPRRRWLVPALGAGALVSAALVGAVVARRESVAPVADAPLPAPASTSTRTSAAAPPETPEPPSTPPPRPGPGPAEGDVMRVDPSTYATSPTVEVRDPWCVETTTDGFWLRGSGGNRSRPGLCVQLMRTEERSFQLAVDLEVAFLEPELPLALVWQHGTQYTAALGVAAQWTEGSAGAMTMVHGLTLQAGPTGSPTIRHGPTTALPPGPQRLRVRLDYEADPPRLRASTEGDVLGAVVVPLSTPLPLGAAYVSVWLHAEDLQLPGKRGHIRNQYSKVLVRSLDLVGAGASGVEPRLITGGARYARLCRRAADPDQLAAVVAELTDGAAVDSLAECADEALFMVALRCAASDALAGRAQEFFALAAARAEEGDERLWGARRLDVFALGPKERRALLAWYLSWNRELDPLTQALKIVRDTSLAIARRDWWLAALVLADHAEEHPLEAAKAHVLAGDFERALALLARAAEVLPQDRIDEVRGTQAWAAFRLRDYPQARRLWEQYPPPGKERKSVFEGLPR